MVYLLKEKEIMGTVFANRVFGRTFQPELEEATKNLEITQSKAS
jgi:hypothetical protein